MEPLQNITEEELKAMNFDGIIALTISRLGAAIDRINELSIDNRRATRMSKSVKEHLIYPSEGTQSVCTCGELFASRELAAQHQSWNLQLASLGKQNNAYADAIRKQVEFQGKMLEIAQRLVMSLESRPPASPQSQDTTGEQA